MTYKRPAYVTVNPPKTVKTIKGFEKWVKRELHKVKNSLTHDIRSNY